MQKRTFHWFIILIIALGLTSLACGAFTGNDEPTAAPPTDASEAETEVQEETIVDTDTEPSEAEQEPMEDSTEADAEDATDDAAEESEEMAEEDSQTAEQPEAQAKTLAVSTIAQPDDVSSYRMVIDAEMVTTDEAEVEQVQAFIIDMSISNDPEAMSLTLSVEGLEVAEESNEVIMTEIEGTTYMVLPGLGCITTTDEEGLGQEDPFAELTDASTFLEDIGEAQFEGEEVINGINTLHYSFDESAFESPDAEVEWAEGHIYIAEEGGWLVRMTMEGEGEFAQLAEVGESEAGMVNMQIDVLDINEPLEFAIPAECEGEGAGGTDWPVVEDAYEVSSLGGFLSYRTDMVFADVLAFYETALADDGWVQDAAQSFVTDETAILTFNRGEEILNLTIVPDDDSDSVSVLIISE